MKHFFLLISFPLLLIGCDSSLQPEIVAVEGKEYSVMADPVEQPTFITPLDSLRLRFKRAAQIHDYEGRILLEFTIDSTGSVKEPEIIKWGNPAINDEVKQIVRSAKFEPAKVYLEPVSIRYSILLDTGW